MGILSILNLHIGVRGFIPLALCFLFSFCIEAGIRETLSKKHPECQFREESKFLTEKEFSEIQEKFPTKKVSKFYSFYKRICGKSNSYDFVFTDVVRTKKQVVHIHIGKNKVQELEVVKFEEPSEYRVRNSWLTKLKSEKLETIDIVSGATLTSKSTKFLVWLSLYLQRDMI